MKLYTYFRSSSSFRVRIALNLKEIEYDPFFIQLLEGKQSSVEYLNKNPQGLIPALEDGSEIFTQSGAIIEYLEEVKPEPALLPKDPAGRAHVRAMVNTIMCEIQPLNNLGTLKYLKNNFGHNDEDIGLWIKDFTARGFSSFEEFIKKYGAVEGYCYGKDVTMADIFLIPQIWNARRFDCDLTPYENILRIEEKLYKLDAFDKARPENQPDAP